MLEHMRDISSDLRAFHRVDDWRTLDGPTFLYLAFRLAAYSGVIAARVAAAAEKDNSNGSASTTETKQVASTAAALRTDPDISAFGEIEVEE